jgi:hypothetical protein
VEGLRLFEKGSPPLADPGTRRARPLSTELSPSNLAPPTPAKPSPKTSPAPAFKASKKVSSDFSSSDPFSDSKK